MALPPHMQKKLEEFYRQQGESENLEAQRISNSCVERARKMPRLSVEAQEELEELAKKSLDGTPDEKPDN